MLIIPAIDLKDGQCVRLKQGRMDESTVFSDDPVQTAAAWKAQGARRLHIVDLNGAFAGTPVNAESVAAIVQAHPELPVQVGGGIRDMKRVEFYINTGAAYIIIGTAAVRQPEFLREACEAFPGKIIAGLDTVGGAAGQVATDGWAESSPYTAVELAEKFGTYGVAALIYTDIARDGMLKGVNIPATVALAEASPLPVIASGGISSLADITALVEAAAQIRVTAAASRSSTSSAPGIIGAITGRALYEGRIDLNQAQQLADGEKPSKKT